jgi:hypothetical protein
MTDLLEAPPAAARDEAVRPVPLLVGALTTASWAAAVGIAPVLAMVLVGWVADPNPADRAVGVIRFALGSWLLAHGVREQVGGGPIGLMPLALTAMVAWQVMRAAGKTARAAGADGVTFGLKVVGAVAAGYSVIGAVIGAFVGGSASAAAVAWAATAGVGVIAGAAGVCRVAAIRQDVVRRLPAMVPAALRDGALAALGIFAAGAAVTLGAFLVGASRILELGRSFGSSVIGTAGLVILCLFYLPTVVVWTVAYLVGPGFAVGTGTTVSAFAVHLGPLPAFPLLAVLPGTPATPVMRILLALPAVVGLAIGARFSRSAGGLGWLTMLGQAAARGPVAGVVVAGMALVAGGSLGAGRLAAVGPSAWRVGLVVAGQITVAVLVGAAGYRGIAGARTWWTARRAR